MRKRTKSLILVERHKKVWEILTRHPIRYFFNLIRMKQRPDGEPPAPPTEPCDGEGQQQQEHGVIKLDPCSVQQDENRVLYFLNIETSPVGQHSFET